MQTQMQRHKPHAATVRAEVSGWDRAGGYFVEKTEVWVEDKRLVICVRRAVTLRSILFVRMVMADGSLESESRLMQVARSHKDKRGGYCVHCRPAQRPARRALESPAAGIRKL